MLKPDRYTKLVLTVIAGALIWLCITLNTKQVQADTIGRVVISGLELPDHKALPVRIIGTQEQNCDGSGHCWYSPLHVLVENHAATPKGK